MSSSKAEIIINESDINDVFQSIYTTIKTNKHKSLGKGSGWIIDSVIDHTISTSKYNPLAGSSYINLPKIIDHPRKRLINIRNIDDNECFKWCTVSTKAGKDFAKTLDFKDMNFPVKITDIHKIKKKNISINICVIGYENKEKYPIYVSKQCCEGKHVDLFLIEEGERKHVLVKDFNRFMYDHSLHCVRKHFYRYCLHAFTTEEILNSHIKNYFKINGKQMTKMPKKGEYVNVKNFERKIKSPFMIYTDFESILVPEDNVKQNPKVLH